MPIVGTTGIEFTTTLGSTTVALASTIGGLVSFNASVYSHSTVFVTQAADDASFTNLNAPPLTTHYTPRSECAERWMLAGGQEVTMTRRVPTYDGGVTTSLQTPSATSALAPLGAPSDFPFATTIAPMVTPAALPPRSGFIAQSYTVFSLDMNGTATDPSYRSCQPYQLAPTYSPGICPDGQTIAEVTAWQVSVSTGYRTFWQASCCRRTSGMTFGPEFYEACISTFSTPIQALVLIITTPFSGASVSTSYEYTLTNYVSSATTYSTTIINSTTVLSTGLAVADPIVVAWQIDDFKLFPTEYASSLARKIGVTLPITGSRTGSVADREPGLSTGAKVGIGVGAAVLALALAIGIVTFCLKKRRKARSVQVQQTIPEMADQDQELAGKKWWTGGKWRSEANTQVDPQELENKTVHVVSGPPAELDGAELQHPDDTGHVAYPQRGRSFVDT